MTEKEFNLSDEVLVCDERTTIIGRVYDEKDVKEFIKKLKERIKDECREFMLNPDYDILDEIDKLFKEIIGIWEERRNTQKRIGNGA